MHLAVICIHEGKERRNRSNCDVKSNHLPRFDWSWQRVSFPVRFIADLSPVGSGSGSGSGSRSGSGGGGGGGVKAGGGGGERNVNAFYVCNKETTRLCIDFRWLCKLKSRGWLLCDQQKNGRWNLSS